MIMSKIQMPWEDRPVGSKEVVWRYSANPIIPRDLLPTSNSIFNSAVVPFGDSYAGVFRCDDTNRRMRLHVGFSADGLRWDIDEADFRLTGADRDSLYLEREGTVYGVKRCDE